MSRYASEPIIKVTLNLNKADVEFVKDRFGSGWSTTIREFLKQKCKELRREDE